ncbi:MAG: hypothetical protein K2H98_02705, partial [Duncaniella sp.]|nr:hypothetical protein [Duncaniella sp.]
MEQTPKASNPIPGTPSAITDNEEETINIGDFLALCLNNWGWFAISICACMILGGYYLISTPKKYTRTASLIITDSNSGGMTPVADMMNNMGLFNTSSDVNNEIIAFQSPDLISSAIKRLGDNITYQAKTTFKPVLLYGDSTQYIVDFLDLDDTRSARLRITNKGGGKLELDKFKPEIDDFPESLTANLGDTVVTTAGRVVIHPGANYKPDYGYPITVNHYSISSAIDMFSAMMKVELASDDASVINLSMTDVSIARADDFINMIITVYNEKWVEDKNVLSNLTSKFIDERLGVIEQELGKVDENISDFKSDHLLPDIKSTSEMYMKRSDDNMRRQLELSTQISIAQFLNEFVSATLDNGGLIPANSGLENSGITQQINDYNKLQLERDRLAQNSSPTNPLVLDSQNNLLELESI